MQIEHLMISLIFLLVELQFRREITMPDRFEGCGFPPSDSRGNTLGLILTGGTSSLYISYVLLSSETYFSSIVFFDDLSRFLIISLGFLSPF